MFVLRLASYSDIKWDIYYKYVEIHLVNSVKQMKNTSNIQMPIWSTNIFAYNDIITPLFIKKKLGLLVNASMVCNCNLSL